MRTIFIGDVHGCADELSMLLGKLRLDLDVDRLIFLGDLINKGPDSLRVLEIVSSLRCSVLMGNHELSFLKLANARLGRKEPPALPSADSSWHQVMKQLMPRLEEWTRYVSGFAPFLETDAFMAVHAGLRPDLPPAATPIKDLATIRTWDGEGADLQKESNPPWYSFYRVDKPVIYGHWAKRGLNFAGNIYGLDSGCVYGRFLSALILETKQLVCVPAKRVYCAINSSEA